MTCSINIPIVILAAGQSRRMRGADKLLQDVGGVSLLRHQVDKATAAGTGPVYAVLPPRPHPRYDVLGDCDIHTIPAQDAHLGMSASLRAGLNALPPTASAAMILLADLPDLTAEDLKKVCSAVDLNSKTLIWRGTTANGAPGHPVVFARAIFPELVALSGDTGGGEVISAHRDRTKLIELPATHARRDLDTPEDWNRWRQDQGL